MSKPRAKQSKKLWQRSWKWFVVGLISASFIFQACQCEPELPPPPPKAEVSISPGSWNIPENPPQGIKLYQTFVIKNKAQASNAEQLEITKLSLDDSSGQFKIIMDKDKDCFPNDPSTGCKETECVLYSNNEALCVPLPISLPIKLAPGGKEQFKFVVQYEANSTGVSPQAKIKLTTNTENNKNEKYTDSNIILGARGGEPVIEVSGRDVKPSGSKEFSMSMGKTNKGETKTQTFKVTNLGDADLKFKLSWDKKDDQFALVTADGKEALDKEFTLPGAAQAPNNALEFKLSYKPADCGDHEARLKITSNAVYKKLGVIDEKAVVSASSLFLRPVGSSPTGVEVNPGTLDFGDIKVGESSTKKFTLAIGQSGLCDVIVYDISIAPLQAGGDTKDFSFGDMLKDGNKVDPPTQAKPITIKKGEKLEVAVVFKPTSKQPSSGVIKIKTNDPNFDPDDTGAVNISAGVERNDKPIARLRFKCGEDQSTACKKDDDLAGQIFKGNETKVKVLLDPSKSIDRENKITNFKFELVKKPPLAALTQINGCDNFKDLSNCHMVVTEPGVYSVKLTVVDDANQEGTVVADLKVDP